MRQSDADPDGIILDSRYDTRVGQWKPDRWQIFQPFVDKVRKWAGPSAMVLDLGAGEGFFTKCCRENGLHAIALEGSPRAVEWGRTQLGIDARVHNLRRSLPFADAAFDFVMYHDVYEHVVDAINVVVFGEAWRVLKSRGMLWVVSTCRYDLVESAEPEHINNPTPSELLRYGRRFGFRGTVLRPALNISLFTPRYSKSPHQRKLRRLLKKHHRKISALLAPVWLPMWYVNARLLHQPLLDFVGATSSVLFRKPASSALSG